MPSYGTSTLQTISEEGKIPDCRMTDARSVQDWGRRLIDNDDRRAFKRSRINGLTDGNPPYRLSKLREAGRADACNVNWGQAKAYLESATGAFYDLFSEAPGYFNIITDFGPEDKKVEYSRIMSEEADRIVQEDPVWDYNMQRSQDQMVLHGCGPMIFEDCYDVLPRSVNTGDLKVPEFTKSDTFYWEACMIQIDYYPPELYEFIKDPVAAEARGWNVEYTKLVIANAMDVKTQPGIRYEWEFYQQELKNNSLQYYDDSKINRIAHAFWKEFDGSITHAIVERDTTVTVNSRDNTWISGAFKKTQKNGTEVADVQYLFMRVGRYRNWKEALHPMYYDRGNGGYHHAVTGLGVKMYSAFEWQNRALCNACDKAFAPKVFFRPTTNSTETTQRFQMTMHSDYGMVPTGYDVVQAPVAGMMQEILTWNEEINNVMGQNLSQYRQQVPPQTSGNPPTKFQRMMEAQQQSSLSKTTFNRYYKQLDLLYAEIIRRMCDLNSTDVRAKTFQDRCVARGLKRECFGRVSKVEAVRVIGQGSSFMRKVAVDGLLPLAGALPEEGRNNLLADKIASEAGQSAVARYMPNMDGNKLASDQQAEATLFVAAMKAGVPPTITSSQDPLVFAATFISAGMQALKSVQQGGNPAEVLKFLSLVGPASGAHLKRFANDPTRKQMYEQLEQMWQQMARGTTQLKAQIGRMQQAQKAQQAKSSMTMTDEQIKQMKAQNDIRLKTMKTQAQLQMQGARTRQQLALADATTASEIRRKNMMALTE